LPTLCINIASATARLFFTPRHRLSVGTAPSPVALSEEALTRRRRRRRRRRRNDGVVFTDIIEGPRAPAEALDLNIRSFHFFFPDE